MSGRKMVEIVTGIYSVETDMEYDFLNFELFIGQSKDKGANKILISGGQNWDGGCDINITAVIQRLETDFERDVRLEGNKQNEINIEMQEREQYKRLKSKYGES